MMTLGRNGASGIRIELSDRGVTPDDFSFVFCFYVSSRLFENLVNRGYPDPKRTGDVPRNDASGEALLDLLAGAEVDGLHGR